MRPNFGKNTTEIVYPEWTAKQDSVDSISHTHISNCHPNGTAVAPKLPVESHGKV